MGWQRLGVEINLVSLKQLADYVRDEATILDELNVTGDKKEWFTDFLDIVGECWTKRKGIDKDVLDGISPIRTISYVHRPTSLVILAYPSIKRPL